jgi:hypothetical protein
MRGGIKMNKKTARKAPAKPKTLRLVYAYEGDEIKLVSKQSVDMLLPSPESKPEALDSFGLKYELRNKEEHPLFGNIIENPLRSDIEVFSDNPERTVRRVEMPKKKGVFVLLVPEIPEAENMVLLENKPSERGLRAFKAGETMTPEMETKEIARFSMH